MPCSRVLWYHAVVTLTRTPAPAGHCAARLSTCPNGRQLVISKCNHALDRRWWYYGKPNLTDLIVNPHL